MARVRVRRRGGRYVAQVSQKRPIDKNLKCCTDVVPAAGTSQNYTLFTTTYPGTITGINIKASFFNNLATHRHIVLIVCVVRDGLAISATASGAGTFAAMFTPEQNVLLQAIIPLCPNTGAGSSTMVWEGQTKSQRKLMGGDLIRLSVTDLNTTVATAGIANSMAIIAQFFVKS